MSTDKSLVKGISISENYMPYTTITRTDNSVKISLKKQNIISLDFKCYTVLPGLYLAENDVRIIERYTQDDIIFIFSREEEFLLINYLVEGQCQIPADNDKFMFMKEGDTHIYLNRDKRTIFNHITDSKLIHIIINKKEFLKYNKDNYMSEYSRIIKTIYDFIYHTNNITFESSEDIKEVLQQIIHFKDNNKLPKHMYVQLKTLELIGLTYISKIEKNRIESPTYSDAQIRVVRKIKNALSRDIASYVSLDVLSVTYGINLTTLKNCFRDMYGKPLYTWYREYKFHRAKELIKNTDYPIAKIANMVGYKSSSKFSKAFKKEMGALPSSYRKNK